MMFLIFWCVYLFLGILTGVITKALYPTEKDEIIALVVFFWWIFWILGIVWFFGKIASLLGIGLRRLYDRF